ncbi:MAG: helix-turn-helix domain-containing protein [Salinivirgaceae bacterium]|nr:helix-turn-helix domain-containing protein [Salinivirgaceae bacterium]
MSLNLQTLVLLPEREWQNFNKKLDEITSLVINRNAEEHNSEWIESEEARRILGISKTTWQLYRDQRLIPFSQFGRKIYVKRADLNAFMNQHYLK